jgi:hypothetical protein
MKRQRKLRTKSGLSITVLIVFIGIFIIGPLSMFVFELARYNLADLQLKNCVDLAALTAACSTTGSNATSASVTQTTAMNQAYYMFTQNSIFGNSLASTPAYTYGTAAATLNPPANTAQLYFQFLNPTNRQPVAYGSSLGKILRITGAWGFVPSTTNFTGLMLGPYVIYEQSDGGLPMLDVVLCLDLSGSMDDFTNISLVQRYQGPTGYNSTTATGGNVYKVATGYNSYNGQGPLYYVLGCSSPTGCSYNATWPMDYFPPSYNGSTSVTVSANFAAHGTHTGSPPPNTINASSFSSSAGQYSDMVANLDGSSNMAYGVTVTNSYGSFTFPAYSAGDTTYKAMGILVEASRGNLESVAVAKAANVPYGAWGITPKAGWWAAYYQTVMSAQSGYPVVTSTNPNAVIPIRHPIGDAIMAAENFFSVMNNDADVHFGLVCFGSNAGSSSTSYMPSAVTGTGQPSALTNYNSGNLPSGLYPPEPVTCPNPMIPLNNTPGPTYSNYSTATPPPSTSVNGAVYSAPNGSAEPYTITSVMAYGGTNIADALDMALSMQLNPGVHAGDPGSTPGTSGVASRPAKSLSRQGASRAIVLFTDGLPTSGGDNQTDDPFSQAEANCANTAGIPIYTIGLCMVPSLQADQTTVLSNTSGTGIAKISGNGATFSQTTSAAGLNAVFQNVARQLVQLVQ